MSRGGGGDTIQLGGLGRALFARDPSCSIPEGTDYSKDTIQLTLEQAAQPTALSDLMQAADPTTMLHDEIDDNGTISATPSPLYGGGSAV